jgi:hypothetical protein
MAFVCENPLVEIDTPLGMRFCGHVPNSPRNKNPKRLIPYFSLTLNVMISQMVGNESVRFGRHIDIEVSYKILRLEIPKLVLILHHLTCFQKGLFGGNFEQKHPWSFRG